MTFAQDDDIWVRAALLFSWERTKFFLLILPSQVPHSITLDQLKSALSRKERQVLFRSPLFYAGSSYIIEGTIQLTRKRRSCAATAFCCLIAFVLE
jgi:hypothetical protein